MKGIICVLILAFTLIFSGCKPSVPENSKTLISGWNIISNDLILDDNTIETGKKYSISQLQLSGDICSSLRDIKDSRTRDFINYLAREAHRNGIREVIVRNQALYDLDFYPYRLKTNDSGLINLDDPEFWQWFKDDYRKMLKLLPDINGLILNFDEFGTHVEDQYSEKLKNPSEKRAALVDSVASVVVGELKLKLYVRNFRYNYIGQKPNPINYRLIKYQDLVVVEKATPGNNLLTDPVSDWIKDVPFPVLIEFDCTHLSDGQGIVSDAFPDFYLNRWQYYLKLPNVAGYCADIQISNENTVPGSPGEVNLYALQAATKNPVVNLNHVLSGFITEKYDSMAVSLLKPAFEKSAEVILSSFYTLGLNMTNHSQLDYESKANYTSNVAARWTENPVLNFGRGINKDLNYWSGIVNHLAPAGFKQPDLINLNELPEVFKNNWLQPEELMDTLWLGYVLKEKEYGIKLAKEALAAIKLAKSHIHDSEKFNKLYHMFNRTLISARLHKAYAQVYFGKRIWQRGELYRNEYLKNLIKQGTGELEEISLEMEQYSERGPIGVYAWEKDAILAKTLLNEVRKSGIFSGRNK